MADETYYSILGISETASAAEIKTAYLRMMREVHPDRLANAPSYWQRQAEEKAKEINEAYSILSNGDKRGSYDAQLASYRGSGAPANGNPRSDSPQSSAPPPPSSTAQGSQAASGPQSTSGVKQQAAQQPSSAAQQHQTAPTSTSSPNRPSRSVNRTLLGVICLIIAIVIVAPIAQAIYNSSVNESLRTELNDKPLTIDPQTQRGANVILKPDEGKSAWVSCSGDSVFLFEGEGYNTNAVGKAQCGDHITIQQEDNERRWSKVLTIQGVSGWTEQQYLDRSPRAQPKDSSAEDAAQVAPSAPQEMQTDENAPRRRSTTGTYSFVDFLGKTAWVSCEGSQSGHVLFENENPNSGIVGQVECGAHVKIQQEDNEWSKILTAQGASGWIGQQYLEMSNPPNAFKSRGSIGCHADNSFMFLVTIGNELTDEKIACRLTVDILDRVNGLSLIRTAGGQEGWLPSDYVE